MKWFKMDCDAQDNLDMRKMVDEWGWEWYGRYWAILGKIGMLVNENNLNFALQTNNGDPFPLRLLANDLSTNPERLTEFLDYLSANHLIDPEAWKKKQLIYSPKLKDRADEYTSKLLNVRTTVEKKPIKVRPSTPVGFELFWGAYPRKVGRGGAKKAFEKIVGVDAGVMVDAIRRQTVERETKVRYGVFAPEWKHPQTWLNNQCWLDQVLSEGEIMGLVKPKRGILTYAPTRASKPWTCDACHKTFPESAQHGHYTPENCPAWKPISPEVKAEVDAALAGLSKKMRVR